MIKFVAGLLGLVPILSAIYDILFSACELVRRCRDCSQRQIWRHPIFHKVIKRHVWGVIRSLMTPWLKI